MNKFLGLIISLICGLFFLIGIFIQKKVKNNEKISLLTTSIAFIVMIGLIVFDLGSEFIEGFKVTGLIFLLLGLFVIKIIDIFVPHHHHDHTKESKSHQLHLEHIGTITLIALMLHNLVEGMAVYNQTITSTSAGLLMAISIGLHNIPLGFQIGNYKTKNYKNMVLIVLLVISSLLGGLILFFVNNISETLVYLISSFTLGMLLYLVIFEFLRELWIKRKNKETYVGFIIGFIVIFLIHILMGS